MALLVVDDHLLVGQAVGGLLSEQCGLRFLGVCTSVAALREALQRDTPQLMLLDVHLPGECWQDAARAFQRCNPEGRLILLTCQSQPLRLPPALAALVLSAVDKSGSWDELVQIVRRWRMAHIDALVEPVPPAPASVQVLSPRELRVFDALGRGLHNKEIALRLGLSRSTVESYRKTISAKLALSGPELVRAAALHRCTRPPG